MNSLNLTTEILKFVEFSKQTAETLFFIKIVKDKDEKNSMIAFKAIAPKHAEDARNIEAFMNKEAVYKSGSKEHQHANLVTLAGADHPEYRSLVEVINQGKGSVPLAGDYLKSTLELDKRRRYEARRHEMFSSRTRNKDPLGENLLQQYQQDIPYVVAKNYESSGTIIMEHAIKHNKTINKKHPIEWATEENVLVRGRPPIEWAMKENVMIGNESALEWANHTNCRIGNTPFLEWIVKENVMAGNESALEWASRTEQQIKNKPILEFAIENYKSQVDKIFARKWVAKLDRKPGSESSAERIITNYNEVKDKPLLEWGIRTNQKIGNKSALEWALDKDIHFNNQPVLEWALINDIKINNKSALEFAVTNNSSINGQMALDWAIDHYRTDDLKVTSKIHRLQYTDEFNGTTYIRTIPIGSSIDTLLNDTADKVATTIDGLEYFKLKQNYNKLFTQHTISGQSPIHYALDQGQKIKGFETFGVVRPYDIQAVEKGDMNTVETCLRIGPQCCR